jgi:hypothetical protein
MAISFHVKSDCSAGLAFQSEMVSGSRADQKPLRARCRLRGKVPKQTVRKMARREQSPRSPLIANSRKAEQFGSWSRERVCLVRNIWRRSSRI